MIEGKINALSLTVGVTVVRVPVKMRFDIGMANSADFEKNVVNTDWMFPLSLVYTGSDGNQVITTINVTAIKKPEDKNVRFIWGNIQYHVSRVRY